MKIRVSILIMLLVLSFNSCTGPRGFQGADGKDGINGESFLGTVFEIEGDFTPANNYTFGFGFPSSFKVFDTDIVLVYILWEVIEYNDGTYDDIWRLLPQTRIFTGNGTEILQYNYDYTYYDVTLFLEGDIDFTTLLPGDLENQVFRVVVLPADFLKLADVSNYNALLKSPQLQIKSVD